MGGAYSERALAVPDVSTVFGLRDRATLEVFYSTGIRRNGLCNLDLSYVDFTRGILGVRQGKGRKERVAQRSGYTDCGMALVSAAAKAILSAHEHNRRKGC